MKTLEELYKEVMASDELKKEFCSLLPEEVEGFAEKHGCKATLDEIKAFLTEKSKAEGEVSEEEVEQIAGGKSADDDEVIWSVFTAGFYCAVTAIDSYYGGFLEGCQDKKCGTAITGDGMLCGR